MKKEIREKNLCKNIKPLVKPPREVKQTIFIVRGGWIPSFVVEGGKLDFYDSLREVKYSFFPKSK